MKIGVVLNNILSTIYIRLIKSFCKVKPNRIVFQGKPDYSDNPRALSDYMVAAGYANQYEINWLVTYKDKFSSISANKIINFFQLRSKIGFLKWNSYRILLTSKYVFASHGFVIPKSKGLPGQRYITLWHGCGYKDNAGEQLERFFDLALVPGPLFVKTKCRFWNTTEDYLLAKGYPRYDWLLRPSENAVEFFHKYRNKAKKVIIWMPTYRNSKVYSGYAEDIISQFPLMASDKEWKNLDKLCVDNSILLLIKLHPSQKAYEIGFDKLKNVKEITNKDFEDSDVQMYEFLALTDGLISDYSSVAVDYLLVNKPIAFALDDYEIYKKARGFVFENPKEYMPGHHLYNFNDIRYFIEDISEGKDTFAHEREMMIRNSVYLTNDYCKEIIRAIGI